jgi:hypothetical protein
VNLVVATPVGGAETWLATLSCGYSESLRLLSHEMRVDTVVDFAEDVVRARNRIAGTVLRDYPEATHVLWWDGDQWPEERRIVREMMESGADVIGAPYTNKRQPVRWIHRPMRSAPPPVDGVLQVEAVGFGFTMTTTACLKEISASARKYTDHPNKTKLANIFGHLFEPPPASGEYYCPEEDEMLLSEDYSFCKRWRDMGGRIMLYLKGGNIVHAGGRGWSVRDLHGVLG